MQIFNRKHCRLSPRACHQKTGECRKLPARGSSGAKANARSAGSGMSRSSASKGTFSAGSSLTSASVLSRSARRCSAGTSTLPNRWRPHSVIGCSGVFCNNCEQLHSAQVCGVSHADQREIPRSGATCRGRARRRSAAAARRPDAPAPSVDQQCDFLFATHERCEMTLARAASAAVRPYQPEERHRLGHALKIVAATFLDDEQADNLGAAPPTSQRQCPAQPAPAPAPQYWVHHRGPHPPHRRQPGRFRYRYAH